jgi:hypothetical protein
VELAQHFLDRLERRVELVYLTLRALERKVDTIMKTLDEVLAVVTPIPSKVDGLKALIDGLKQQLADALAGTTLPPAVQAKVDAIFETAKNSSDKIDAALAANTPPTP